MRPKLRSNRRQRNFRQRYQFIAAAIKHNRERKWSTRSPQSDEQRHPQLTKPFKWLPGCQTDLQSKQPKPVQLQEAAAPISPLKHELNRPLNQDKQTEKTAWKHSTVNSVDKFDVNSAQEDKHRQQRKFIESVDAKPRQEIDSARRRAVVVPGFSGAKQTQHGHLVGFYPQVPSGAEEVDTARDPQRSRFAWILPADEEPGLTRAVLNSPQSHMKIA